MDNFISRLKGFYSQNPRQVRRIGLVILLIMIMTWLTCINMCGYLGIGGHLKWKEEVLLHDGSKIIVQRWQKTFNVYTLEKSTLLQKQSLSFKHPKTKKRIVWEDGPTEGIRTANFNLIALHIKDDTPYIITQTYGCFAYNRWGRPNPPYVIFKYENEKWKRIPLEELPPEFTSVNLMMDVYVPAILRGPNLIPAEKIKKSNDRFHRPLFRAIVRTPMEGVGCPWRIYDGQGGWRGVDYRNMEASYWACRNECLKVLSELKYCPCDKLFNKNGKGE